MKPTWHTHRLLLVACAAVWVAGCEKHVVSTSVGGDYLGMRMIPTQVEAPPPPPEQPWSFPNPFKWIGDGFAGVAGVFKGDGAKPMQINSQGQSVQVPADFSGQTSFTAADGRNYHLRYDKGALVGVEQQSPPAAPAKTAPPSPAVPTE